MASAVGWDSQAVRCSQPSSPAQSTTDLNRPARFTWSSDSDGVTQDGFVGSQEASPQGRKGAGGRRVGFSGNLRIADRRAEAQPGAT
jgi:hypothetical protein